MFCKDITKKQRGAALLFTLICVALGGIIIATSTAFADTMLRSTYFRDERNKAVFAADAGIEDALWCIKNSVPPRASLPQPVNGYNVTINAVSIGFYTIYAGEYLIGSDHADWMTVTEDIVDLGANTYKYTITVNREPSCEGNIKLAEVGARIPPGYSYQRCDEPGNLSQDAPSITLDGHNAEFITWVFGSPRPELDESNPTAWQTFYFTGSGELSGYYSWAVASRQDIGTISSLRETYIPSRHRLYHHRTAR